MRLQAQRAPNQAATILGLLVIAQVIAQPLALQANGSPVYEARDIVVGAEAVIAHVEAAIASLEGGENREAILHSNLALKALESLESKLRAANGVDLGEVPGKLGQFRDSINSGDLEEAVSLAKTVEEEIYNRVYSLVPSSLREDFIFNVLVTIRVLELASQAYEEAFIRGFDESKYAEASALIARGMELYDRLDKSVIPSEEDEEIRELLDKAISLLGDASEYEKVVANLKAIAGELREIIGVGEEEKGETEESPLAFLEEARRLVEDALSLYKKGEYEEAEELIVEAYLENYELAEDAVSSVDPSLNEEIEKLLREELRFKIAERANVSEVENLARELLDKLDRAEKLLTTRAEAGDSSQEVETTTVIVETPGGLGVVGKTALVGLSILVVAELAVILKLLRKTGVEAPG